MVNIKQIVTNGLALLFLNIFIFPVFAQQGVTMLSDGVYSYIPGDGYASMFVVTTRGVIAIEPVSTEHARGMVRAIQSVTNKPIRYLLHSHNHWDHSKGGQVFRDAGAEIMAHNKAYQWMLANPHPDMALPNKRWIGKRRNLRLGRTIIEMHYMGLSHGLGMTVFRVVKRNPAHSKIVYIADLAAPKRVLFSIAPDFNINEWIRALSKIEAMDFDMALFSHQGNSGYIGSKIDVIENREFIEDLQTAIIDEFNKGTPAFQIPQVVDLPKYSNWAMYNEWLPLNVWKVMLDMQIGPFPWHREHIY